MNCYAVELLPPYECIPSHVNCEEYVVDMKMQILLLPDQFLTWSSAFTSGPERPKYGVPYSCRSAIIGSTLDARRAAG